ncbi:TetR family transcriptional regulator [Aeromicrobium sp. Root495]|uniref:TetR/AcrR family transcriptional regulator n=1 Tax=Aeromicrobium sp. Root495 TaxID=1736550 RepID=UPI0007023C40|nr:TetR/AcrR family transcriptional regulator [Aeromicrobium sp. Root495]KQY58219.1 TetR family transcriptional regulator [Aeromicrobium sp. Root495]
MSREQKILQAAERLFSERSFDGVGIDAIGKEAGIVGSGVYRHFSSKQEILATLMDEVIDAMLLQVPETTDDPRADLRALVAVHVRFCLGRAQLADIWQRENHLLTDDHLRRFTRRQHQYIEHWVGLLDACYPGHPREDLVATIRGVHALMSSDTTRRAGSRPPADLESLLVRLAMAAMDGLRTED